jgi:hypothetical protein
MDGERVIQKHSVGNEHGSMERKDFFSQHEQLTVVKEARCETAASSRRAAAAAGMNIARADAAPRGVRMAVFLMIEVAAVLDAGSESESMQRPGLDLNEAANEG